MNERNLGWLAVFGGAAVAVYGLYVLSKSKGLNGSLGKQAKPELKERSKSGGMTLSHYRNGDMPIKQRVGLLQDLVWKSVKNPELRGLALAITGDGERVKQVGKQKFVVKGAGCPARDGNCEAKAIYNWTRKNIRYTGDIAPVKMGKNGPVEGIDLFQTANRTIEMGGEDCDGHAVVNATLLALNGIPSKFRITASKPTADWGHIYTMAGLEKGNPTRWVALDTTLPGYNYGTEAKYGRKIDFDT